MISHITSERRKRVLALCVFTIRAWMRIASTGVRLIKLYKMLIYFDIQYIL